MDTHSADDRPDAGLPPHACPPPAGPSRALAALEAVALSPPGQAALVRSARHAVRAGGPVVVSAFRVVARLVRLVPGL